VHHGNRENGSGACLLGQVGRSRATASVYCGIASSSALGGSRNVRKLAVPPTAAPTVMVSASTASTVLMGATAELGAIAITWI
jgi:hypothetical protein